MRDVGKPSWRFVWDVPELLHRALYVRDVLGLLNSEHPGAATASLPPRVVGEIPDQRDLLLGADQGTVEQAWLRWWMALLNGEVAAGPADQSPHEWQTELAERYRQGVNPLDVDASAGSSVLVRAAGVLQNDVNRWVSEAKRSIVMPGGTRPFEWRVVAAAVAYVADERGVPLSAVRGYVGILAVQGIWWRHLAPGKALCSVQASRDEEIAEVLLRESLAPSSG